MNTQIHKNLSKYIGNTKTIVSLLLIIPILGGFFAVQYYNNSYKKVEIELSEKQGEIAGAKKKNVTDITELIPMMPETEISSVDTSNNEIHITLISKDEEKEVKTFYEDYFFMNGWEQEEVGVYIKGLQKVKCEIGESIINLTLTGFD